MPELTLRHIDQISNDIGRQEITFSHLLEDLIDHVCCDVEYEMQEGLTFNDAYKKVKQKIGSRGLKEIQEETLYAVDTNYRYMKNTMKISGVAGTIMLGLAATFKIQHWPGAGILITLGALLLAFVFLPSALGVLWKETHSRKRLALFISAFIAGVFLIFGTLFKIQHWPGAGLVLSLAALSGILFFIPSLLLSKLTDQEKKAKRAAYILGAVGTICYVAGMVFKIQHWPLASFLLAIGVVFLCVIAFPWYTWITWKEESHIKAGFIFIVIGFLAIIVPGAMINLNLQNAYDYGYYSHQEQQQVLFNTKYTNNLAIRNQYRDSSAYPLLEQLHSKTAGLLTLIGTIQTKMVAESEGKPGVPALDPAQVSQTERGPEIQYKLLSKPFQTAPVTDFLMPGAGSRQELITALTEYKNYVSGLNSGKDIDNYEGLDPLIFLPGDNNSGGTISLMSALHSLELLKNSIVTVESYVLVSIANK
ncbi:MAG: hypothetical protein WCS03_11255 [Bacteroidota bacterium]